MRINGFVWLTGLIVITLYGCNEDEGLSSTNCIDASKIDLDAACIEIYEPVCGCDNITYSNSCFAEISGVTSWREGSCVD